MTPRYTSTGCSKPWQSTGYKDRSSLGGAFEITDAEIKWRLFWRSMRGGAGLLLIAAIGGLSIIAIHGGAS